MDRLPSDEAFVSGLAMCLLFEWDYMRHLSLLALLLQGRALMLALMMSETNVN